MTQAITPAATEVATVAVCATKEAAGPTDNARTVLTANLSPGASRLTLKQPPFNWKAKDMYPGLFKLEIQVKKILMTKSYNIEDSDKVPTIMNSLGHEELHFVQILNEDEKKDASQVQGFFFNKLNEKSRPQHKETILSLQYSILSREEHETAKEWIGWLRIKANECNYKGHDMCVKEQFQDMQMTMHSPKLSPKKITLVKHIIEEKVDRIKNWMWMNQLQMNHTKTELIKISNLLSKIDLDSITVRGITVNCSKKVKFLGAILDETFSFRQHVAAQTKLALYRIHLIRNVRKYLTVATTKMIMCAIVLSQLDCINSILTNISPSTTKPYKKSRTKLLELSTKRPNGPVPNLYKTASLATNQMQESF